MTKTYIKKQCVQFVEDMENAGINVEHYRGRFFWQGPAVRTNEKNGPTLQEVFSATKIKCQRDNLASDWIVYPVVSDDGLGINGLKEKEFEIYPIGDCRSESLVETIFGSVSEFARQIEEKGNEFVFQNIIIVKYNKDKDLHTFWEKC